MGEGDKDTVIYWASHAGGLGRQIAARQLQPQSPELLGQMLGQGLDPCRRQAAVAEVQCQVPQLLAQHLVGEGVRATRMAQKRWRTNHWVKLLL